MHAYSNRPGLETTKVFVPLAKRPVSKDLSTAVTLCSAESLFSTVMVSPTFACSVSGPNSKLEMVTVLPAPAPAEPDPLSPPQAVPRRSAIIPAATERRAVKARKGEHTVMTLISTPRPPADEWSAGGISLSVGPVVASTPIAVIPWSFGVRHVTATAAVALCAIDWPEQQSEIPCEGSIEPPSFGGLSRQDQFVAPDLGSVHCVDEAVGRSE